MNPTIIPAILAIAILVFFIMLTSFVPVGLWITARAAGVRVRIFADLVGMRLRRVPPKAIVEPQIAATKAGLNLTLDNLEAHYLAGGNVGGVVSALIAADKANIKLDFARAAAIDLAGRDVLKAVQMSVNPQIIDVPPKEEARTGGIAAVARDGIQLLVKARVTVRANIDRLVGGAGEATVIARVGQGIITTIGSAASHKEVLESPARISKTVLAKGLAAGTAFEILSIDIADIDIGENVGAKLQTDQAQAELKIARAKAEEKRAMAQAQEEEMKALVEEMTINLIEAEKEIPLGIADAFASGRMSVMDYYNLRNVIADTEMRQSIAKPGGSETTRSAHSLGLS